MSQLDDCLKMLDNFFDQKEIEIKNQIDRQFKEKIWSKQQDIDSQIDLKLEDVIPEYKKQIKKQNENPQELVNLAQQCVRQEMSNSYQNQVQPFFENQIVNVTSQLYDTFYKGFQHINKQLDEKSLTKSHNKYIDVTNGISQTEKNQIQQDQEEENIEIHEKFQQFSQQMQNFANELDKNNKQLKYDLKTFYKPLDKNHNNMLKQETLISEFLDNEKVYNSKSDQTYELQDQVYNESLNIYEQFQQQHDEIQQEKEKELKEQQIEKSFQRSQKRNDSFSSMYQFEPMTSNNPNNISLTNFNPQPLIRTTSETMGNFSNSHNNNNNNNPNNQIHMNSSQLIFNSPQLSTPQVPSHLNQQLQQINQNFQIPIFNSSDSNNTQNKQNKSKLSNSNFLLKQKSYNQKQFMSQQNSSNSNSVIEDQNQNEEEQPEDTDEDLENEIEGDSEDQINQKQNYNKKNQENIKSQFTQK